MTRSGRSAAWEEVLSALLRSRKRFLVLCRGPRLLRLCGQGTRLARLRDRGVGVQ